MSPSKQVEGKKTFDVGGESFALSERYCVKGLIGRGAHGVVVSVSDNQENGCTKAIKKMPNCFESLGSSRQLIREVRLLGHFNHPNIVGLLDLIPPTDTEESIDAYLVMESMQSDLGRLIESKNELSDAHISLIVYQLLLAIEHVHSSNIIHRDVTPRNVLINADSSVKLCDFGLSRGFQEGEGEGNIELDNLMTEYVVSRWYRAPEVVLCPGTYGPEIDIWGVGCILAELYMRKPVFPGKNYIDQLDQIFNIIGTPSREQIDELDNLDSRNFCSQIEFKRGDGFNGLIPSAPPAAIDLLSQMLTFDPSTRISAKDALEHPLFARYHKPTHVLEATKLSMDFEKLTRTKDTATTLYIREIYKFRPESYHCLRSALENLYPSEL